MATKTFTPTQLEGLKRLGWEFLPIGPNRWGWLKFDECGHKIAQGGGGIWSADVASVGGSGMSSDAIVIERVAREIVKALDRLTDAIEVTSDRTEDVAEQLGDVVCEIYKVNGKLSLK